MAEAMRQAAPGESVTRLVPVLPRDPPPELIERLRELDARTELAYVAENTWVLGRMMPLDERQERVRKMIENELALPENMRRDYYIRILRLYEQGLRVWGVYTNDEVQNGKVYRDFELGMHGIRNTSDNEALALSRRSAERAEEARAKNVLELVEAEFRSLHGIKMRHRLSTHGR